MAKGLSILYLYEPFDNDDLLKGPELHVASLQWGLHRKMEYLKMVFPALTSSRSLGDSRPLSGVLIDSTKALDCWILILEIPKWTISTGSFKTCRLGQQDSEMDRGIEIHKNDIIPNILASCFIILTVWDARSAGCSFPGYANLDMNIFQTYTWRE